MFNNIRLLFQFTLGHFSTQICFATEIEKFFRKLQYGNGNPLYGPVSISKMIFIYVERNSVSFHQLLCIRIVVSISQMICLNQDSRD